MIDGQMFEAMCTDIGQGGAYLATAVMAAPGTQLGIALASPHGSSMIAAKAEVLYTVHRSATRPTGLAVRWLEMPPSLERTIAAIEDAPAIAAAEAETSPLPIPGQVPSSMQTTAPYRAVPSMPSALPRTQPKHGKR